LVTGRLRLPPIEVTGEDVVEEGADGQVAGVGVRVLEATPQPLKVRAARGRLGDARVEAGEVGLGRRQEVATLLEGLEGAKHLGKLGLGPSVARGEGARDSAKGRRRGGGRGSEGLDEGVHVLGGEGDGH
jgi:hypothetical protein